MSKFEYFHFKYFILIPTSNCLGIVTLSQSLCHSTRAFAMAARVTNDNIDIIGHAQKNLNAANANAKETSKFVNDANAIANADLQAAKNEYDKINNDKIKKLYFNSSTSL